MARTLCAAWCRKCKSLFWVTPDSGGLCPKCRCNHDCLNCTFTDCIYDGEDEAEIAASEQMDRMIRKERWEEEKRTAPVNRTGTVEQNRTRTRR